MERTIENVRVKSIDGSTVEVSWKDIMESARELLIKESQYLLRQQREHCDYPTNSDVLLYRPGENDRVLRHSPVIETLVSGLHPRQDIAAAATLGNMMVSNAAPDFCSENLLSMADILHNGGASTNATEMAKGGGYVHSTTGVRVHFYKDVLGELI